MGFDRLLGEAMVGNAVVGEDVLDEGLPGFVGGPDFFEVGVGFGVGEVVMNALP